MDEQLLDKLLEDFGDQIYPSSELRINIGHYSEMGDIEPGFVGVRDKDGNISVKPTYDEDVVLACCITGFKNALREEGYSEDEIRQVTIANLGDALAREESINYACYVFETRVNEDEDGFEIEDEPDESDEETE